MSLTLQQAEATVRARTRHPSESDPRATPTIVRAELNRAYQDLRLVLAVGIQEDGVWIPGVPELYVSVSGDLVLPDDEANTIELDETECGVVSDVWRVDRYDEGAEDWFPIDRADQLDPTQSPSGSVNFYRRGKCVVLGPRTFAGGTYRVLYHVVPTPITEVADLFKLPSALDQALVFMAAGFIFFNDGDLDMSEACDKRAMKIVKRALPALQEQHGLHPKRAGLRYV